MAASTVIVRHVTATVRIHSAGITGAQGPSGEAGLGVPVGGSSGQVLAKTDATDYNTAWQDAGTPGPHAHQISDVVNLQVELDNRPIIIGGEFGPGVTFDSLSDVTITSAISGHITQHNGTVWINRTLAAAGIAASIHTHTESDISDLQAYLLSLAGLDTGDLAEGTNLYYADERVDDRVASLLVAGTNITLTYNDTLGTLTIDAAGGGGGISTVDAATDTDFNSLVGGELQVWNGTDWVNQNLAGAGIAAASHNHDATDIDSGTLDDARLSSNVGKLATAGFWSATQIFSGIALLGVGGSFSQIISLAASTRTITLGNFSGEFVIASDGSPVTNDTLFRLADGSYDSRKIVAGDISGGTLSDARISESSVSQHEAALAIGYSQLSAVPLTFTPSAHNQDATTITSGVLADARLQESNITQYESALSITESQISDLAHATNTDVKTMGIRNTIDGGGSEPTALISKVFIEQDCTIVAGSIMPDVSGSITLTVKRDRGGETTLGTLTLTSAASLRDTTLSGWTIDLDAGDTLIFDWGSGTTLTSATGSLGLEAR